MKLFIFIFTGCLFAKNAFSNSPFSLSETTPKFFIADASNDSSVRRENPRIRLNNRNTETTTEASSNVSAGSSSRRENRRTRQNSKIADPVASFYENCKGEDLSSLTNKTEGSFCVTCSVRRIFGFEQIREVAVPVQIQAFKEKLKKRVLGQIESKIFQTQILKACIKKDRNWFDRKKVEWSLMKHVCQKKTSQLKDSISDNWSKMRIHLALSKPSLREDRIIPDTSAWFDSTPSHIVSQFNRLPRLNNKEKARAKRIYVDHLLKTDLESPESRNFKQKLREGSHNYDYLSLNSEDRFHLKKQVENLRESSKNNYTRIMSDLPILGYIESESPNKRELATGLSKIEDQLREFLEKAKEDPEDMGLLLSFRPLVEEILAEDKNFCLVAEGARRKENKRESTKNWMLLGAGILAAVPCFMAGPVSAGVCLTAGVGLGVVGHNQASQATEESLGRVLTGKDFETIAGLEEKAREEFLAKLFLPLSAWGTTAVPARATLNAVSQTGRRIRGASSASTANNTKASQSVDDFLKTEEPRLLKDYDSILGSRTNEEKTLILSTIAKLEQKGLNKNTISEKLKTAIGKCNARR